MPLLLRTDRKKARPAIIHAGYLGLQGFDTGDLEVSRMRLSFDGT